MLTGKSETQTNVVPLRSASAQKNTEQKKTKQKKKQKKLFIGKSKFQVSVVITHGRWFGCYKNMIYLFNVLGNMNYNHNS